MVGAAVLLLAVTAALVAGRSAAIVLAGQKDPPPRTAPDQEAPAGRQPPDPPAAKEHAGERARMVRDQISHPRDGRRRITDEQVIEAMKAAPRHVFVPQARRGSAYLDTPLPIGYGQTISQPYIVALMSELLEIDEDDKVLEIGTGSGYQAAVLAHLTPNVYTVEIIEPLAERAEKALRSQRYDSVRCRRADGYDGWAEHGPFDAVIVTCAAGHLPPPLWEQLAPGGRIVIPVGGPYDVQRLIVVNKEPDGSRRSRTITQVRFVPMTREEQD